MFQNLQKVRQGQKKFALLGNYCYLCIKLIAEPKEGKWTETN